jgi:hypothetical protein
LELFSLEEKAAQLPGGLFDSAHKAESVFDRESFMRPTLSFTPDKKSEMQFLQTRRALIRERPSKISGADDRN